MKLKKNLKRRSELTYQTRKSGKFVSFWKVNSEESEFRCLVVLWKMNWKTLSCVWLCYGKETEK
jgi:hypothetical protein